MKIHASCEIHAPISNVFDIFTNLSDLKNHVSAIQDVEILTPGPIGVGTKFKETRVMFGKEADETMEITGFAPPHTLKEEARSAGMHYVSVWTFSEKAGITTVSIDFAGIPQTLSARLLGFIFSFMAGSMKKAFLADMNDLKKVLENEEVQSG